jgi:hypothetical protein
LSATIAFTSGGLAIKSGVAAQLLAFPPVISNAIGKSYYRLPNESLWYCLHGFSRSPEVPYSMSLHNAGAFLT